RQVEILELKGKQDVKPKVSGSDLRGPKLPAFEEGKDNIDSYLQRFERFATTQGWDREGQWASNLSVLLKGRALDVFSRLPVDQSLDYSVLKDALLKRFETTEQGFRKKFKTGRPEAGETFVQFAVRLDSYFLRWLEMANSPKTFEGVKDLIIRDQFIQACGNELTLFLKERIPATITEMAKLADQFADARGNTANLLKFRPDGHKKQFNGVNSKSGDSQVIKQSSTEYSSRSKQSGSGKHCFICNKTDHLSYNCPKKSKKGQVQCISARGKKVIVKPTGDCDMEKVGKEVKPEASGTNILSTSCERQVSCGMPVIKGRIGNHSVMVLRDTGCSGAVIRRSLVADKDLTGETQTCVVANGDKVVVPIAKVFVDSPYFVGSLCAWCMDNPVYDVILGNIPGVRHANGPDKDWKPKEVVQAVQTRAQVKRDGQQYRPLKVPKVMQDIGSPDEIKETQMTDGSLAKYWHFVKEGSVKDRTDGGSSRFYVGRGLLYREFHSPGVEGGRVFKQLVIPEKLRSTVVRLAHDTMMAGHLGAKKTMDRIRTEFFWPGMASDVTRFCRSCDVCQRTIPKGRISKVPLGQMPLIDTPFQRVAIDLVGPLQPVTDRGNRYILTIVDYATRYPEAVALKGIETERVAEALVDVYSRVGIPREVLTDCGTQFTSELMQEVSRLLSIRQLSTTPYHPMCNGLVERFNGTLKAMLRKMCAERPRDWDKYLNALLFAYREVPQESLGYSPFELLYGRTVRGPMMILRELWTKEVPDPDTKTTYQYVVDLKDRLEETCKLAQEQLRSARSRQAKYYNRKAKARDMKPGDKVLVLLPTKRNKLLMQWRGPYMIEEKRGSMDYRVNVEGKKKTLHANLLKLYVERRCQVMVGQDFGVLSVVCNAMVTDEDESEDDDFPPGNIITIPPPTRTESIDDVAVSELLTSDQTTDIRNILAEFEDVLTDVPGKTNLGKHDIKTTTCEPVRVKSHSIPYSMKNTIKEELDKMLRMGVIEPSESPYAAPVVIVREKDGTNRFCIDFRQLNRVTIFDAEPMPNADDIFARLSGHKYFSRLDLIKGYWQVPMSKSAQEKTAFTTLFGLFQFSVMPFGLVNAPATFCRIMRKLLRGMDGIESFIDDILIYSRNWNDHMRVLRDLFTRLRKANLTARPSKCALGYGSLECLGHIVGDQRLLPNPDKVKAILSVPRPETKKQVRSFLGMAGYYQKFIPDFAAISVPLTDLTRKGQPHKIVWGEAQVTAFETLKKVLSSSPILKLPSLEEEFILQTDAFDYGIGAVLLQEEAGDRLPVAYASRKLKGAETAYAVVEKECLAVVWGVLKFQRYLYGRHFVLETDHQPLLYLNKLKGTNSRLMRWALVLQPYRFTIRAIRGSENVGADCLSRL
ncbi:uncharacterized protein, partial [Argopecten irradians]|uniref:uncharacterized protein n=1 Tax=Argopecten irradians TaxID=31199 RepID=UPI0037139A87